MAVSAALKTRLEPVLLEREIHLQVVSDYSEFVALEPVWDRVLKAADQEHRHPFLEFCWARTWWDCFGRGSTLQIIVLWRNDEPIAIAPLMLSRTRLSGVPVRCLGFLYNSHVPRADFLIGKYSEQAYRAIWRYLSTHRCWDILQLCQLQETSATFTAISRLAENDGFGTGAWEAGASPRIDTTVGWTEYFDSLPAKHRSNLRNRLKRIGPVEVETVTTSGLDQALEDGFRIEASAWKGDAGTAIACSAELRELLFRVRPPGGGARLAAPPFPARRRQARSIRLLARLRESSLPLEARLRRGHVYLRAVATLALLDAARRVRPAS